MIAILPALERRAGEDHARSRGASRVTCDALTGTLDRALGRIGICGYQTDGQERVSADRLTVRQLPGRAANDRTAFPQ